jgi:asparagine synthase (glutamine-hydrolysing)
MMHLDLRITLADNDLRKVCAMTRMAGVKVRFPFLDEDVVEFAATIPSNVLLQGGELRAFYKAAMKDFLPREVIEKKKHGFGMPYDVWLQRHSAMRAIALDAARDFKRRKICTDAYIDGLVERTSVGDIGAASRLWDIMTLELWLAAHGHRGPGA